MIKKITSFLKTQYQEFISIQDSPHRIAISFSLGVFLGILPFTGFIAAVALAWYFRLNKAAAFLGSVLTNTWVGFIVLALSIKISAPLWGLNSQEVSEKFHRLFKDFHWHDLSDAFMLKILGAVLLSFLILSILLSVVAYGVCLAIIYWQRRPR